MFNISTLTPLYLERTKGAFLDEDDIIRVRYATIDESFTPDKVPLQRIFFDCGYIRVTCTNLSMIYAYDGYPITKFKDYIRNSISKGKRKTKERMDEKARLEQWQEQQTINSRVNVVVGIDKNYAEVFRDQVEVYLIFNTNYTTEEQKKYVKNHMGEWLNVMIKDLQKSKKYNVLKFLQGCYVKSVKVSNYNDARVIFAKKTKNSPPTQWL